MNDKPIFTIGDKVTGIKSGSGPYTVSSAATLSPYGEPSQRIIQLGGWSDWYPAEDFRRVPVKKTRVVKSGEVIPPGNWKVTGFGPYSTVNIEEV